MRRGGAVAAATASADGQSRSYFSSSACARALSAFGREGSAAAASTRAVSIEVPKPGSASQRPGRVVLATWPAVGSQAALAVPTVAMARTAARAPSRCRRARRVLCARMWDRSRDSDRAQVVELRARARARDAGDDGETGAARTMSTREPEEGGDRAGCRCRACVCEGAAGLEDQTGPREGCRKK